MSSSSALSGVQRRKVFFILLLGFASGAAADRFALGSLLAGTSRLNFPLISQAWQTIRKVYVDRNALNSGAITYGAIDGMVNALGDTGHSRFMTPDMLKKLTQLENNNFEGIGAEVQIKEGHLVIVAPIEGSPAQKAGLKPGDIILKVNGVTVTGMKLDQAIERITGPAGSEVTVTVMSQGSDRARDITLTRGRITVHEVTWHPLNGTSVAHLHIANFGKGVREDLIQALQAIKSGEFRGMVLDLRNNPGGLLREAIGTVSQFSASGNVLLEKDAEGKMKPIPVQPGGIATGIRLAVLVNRGSASASEIVAGALQDSKRAPIIGEATFGTGTVLSEFKLSDGSALLLAVEEWLTPNGHVIWHKGITPDITVGLAPDTVPLFPESEQNLSTAQWRDIPDKQLAQAIEVLSR